MVEVVIGVAILSIVMASITVLTIVSIQANQANVNRLTAYYLAQEGLEGLRNLRDTNWLQNYGWDLNFDVSGIYKIDYQPDGDPPWELTPMTDATQDSTLSLVNDAGKSFYVHDTSAWGGGADSRFSRYLYVEHHDVAEDVCEVMAVVYWDDHGRANSVEVSTLLSDWREGPI